MKIKKALIIVLMGLCIFVATFVLSETPGGGGPEPIQDPEAPVVEGFKTFPGKKKYGFDQYWFCQTRLSYTDCWVLVPDPN